MSAKVRELEKRISALEAFVADVMRSQTFTAYGGRDGPDTQKRTPIGNKAAVLLGVQTLPTNGGLDATWDSVS